MTHKTLTIGGLGGQHCDVVITVTEYSSHASFRSRQGYGYPTLTLDELRRLVEQLEILEAI